MQHSGLICVYHMQYSVRPLTPCVCVLAASPGAVGRDTLGEPGRAGPAGRHRGLPQGAAEALEGGEDAADWPRPRGDDEGVPRLAASLRRPQTRGVAGQVSASVSGRPSEFCEVKCELRWEI